MLQAFSSAGGLSRGASYQGFSFLAAEWVHFKLFGIIWSLIERKVYTICAYELSSFSLDMALSKDYTATLKTVMLCRVLFCRISGSRPLSLRFACIHNIDFRTDSGSFSCKLFRSVREERCSCRGGRLCPQRTASLIGGLDCFFP